MSYEIVETKPYTYQLNLDTDLVVTRYREIARALNQMFIEMGERSEVEGWRFNGVGSCGGVDGTVAEVGLVGPAKNNIWKLREWSRYEQKDKYQSPIYEDHCCPFHREAFGCLLGDLKGPLCLEFIDFPHELNQRFRINGERLRKDINKILTATLIQNPQVLDDPLLEDISSDKMHQLALDAIEEMTEYVKKFPVLKDDERIEANKFKNGLRPL